VNVIITSTPTDRAKVIDTIVLGFTADPFVRWLFPDPQDYLTHFPVLMQLFAGKAFEQNAAFHLDGHTTSALWLPPGAHPDEEGIVTLLEAHLGAEKLADAFSAFEQMDAFHPDEPCWHLAFLATDPAFMGKGYGSSLLESSLEHCDKDGKLAYLESTNPANLSLYERYGFRLIGKIETKTSPPLFPMVRESR
jgi:ribosomal protein S18 acetylase RimI-like enzyme